MLKLGGGTTWAVVMRPTFGRPTTPARLLQPIWSGVLATAVDAGCSAFPSTAGEPWRSHLIFVRPATVIGWHRRDWWLFWRWQSRPRLGRPRLGAEVRELIATMSRDNPLWGADRIRGELLKLGVIVGSRSLRRYRWRGPSRRPGQGWRTFLANHRPSIWAADLFTVQTLTFRTL